MKKVYVIQAENAMGVRFYSGAANRWTAERPDAVEFPLWTKAAKALDELYEAYPQSPAVAIAKVVEEEQEAV